MSEKCPKCDSDNFEYMVSEAGGDGVVAGREYGVCHACKSVMNKCEVYSRVCGYLRPTTQWNKGKKQEFKDRKDYKIGKAVTDSMKEPK